MIQRHVLLSLGSRIAAAVLNLLSVGVFARMAGAAGYGEYLVAFAWAYIVYAFAMQWLRFAFFAGYEADRSQAHVSTYAALVLGAVATVISVATLLVLGGLVRPQMAVAVAALATTIATYDAVCEIGRARLEAERIAAAVMMRAVLMLALGAAAIHVFQSALALALAVALAHVVATLPLWTELRTLAAHMASREVARRFVAYGWPLIPAIGLGSIALNLDRLLLERWGGAELVGIYGAASNIVKQCFFVVGEGISGAYIAIAKRAASEGDDARARDVLLQAFRAFMAMAAFGTAGFMTIGDPALQLLLSARLWDPFAHLLPLLVVAAVLTMLRTFYFGQVIFFAGSSRMELAVAAIDTVTILIVGLILIPTYGATGAAIALLVAQLFGCIAYIVGGRRLYEMPVSMRDAAGIAAIAGAGLLAGLAVNALVPLSPLAFALEVAILAVLFLVAVRRYDLFGLGRLVAPRTWLRVALRRGG